MENSLNKKLAQRREIIQRVDRLPDRHKQAFAIACCGRLAPSCAVLPLVYKTDIHNVVNSVMTRL